MYRKKWEQVGQVRHGISSHAMPILTLVLLNLNPFLKTLLIQISWLLMKPADQDSQFSILIENTCLPIGMLQVNSVKIGEECSTNIQDKIPTSS